MLQRARLSGSLHNFTAHHLGRCATAALLKRRLILINEEKDGGEAFVMTASILLCTACLSFVSTMLHKNRTETHATTYNLLHQTTKSQQDTFTGNLFGFFDLPSLLVPRQRRWTR